MQYETRVSRIFNTSYKNLEYSRAQCFVYLVNLSNFLFFERYLIHVIETKLQSNFSLSAQTQKQMGFVAKRRGV